MRIHLHVFIVILLSLSSSVFAQKRTALIKGKVLNSTTRSGYADIRINIPALNVFTTSDGNGNFILSEIPFGAQILVISGNVIKNDTIKILVDKKLVVLEDIHPVPSERITATENAVIPTIAIVENSTTIDDDNVSSTTQSPGGMFTTTSDPFLSVAVNLNHNFHYMPRGYIAYELQINGIPVSDLERKFTSWSQFGGLNDVLHGRNETYGLRPSEYNYGGIWGTTYIDATAADQRKGTTATYTLTNRNYRNRVMLTHSSGLNNNGWAYSLSASRRWAEEGYIDGTFYDGYSFYGAVTKVHRNHQFNLTAFTAPTIRGGSTFASTDEVYKLSGNNQYNSLWGYQDGKKRNARVTDVNQPIIVLSHTYKPSDRTRYNTSIGYEFGKYKISGIDYYNAYSPAPDYYRNLPSYYQTFSPPETSAADAIEAQLQDHPGQLQINWDQLYNSNYINYETIKNINGVAGNDFTGRRSMYVMSNRVDDQRTLSFNANVVHALDAHTTINGGITVISQADEFYKQLTDLMGGDYFVNYNQFAVQQSIGNINVTQNDLNHPNQLIKVGDKYDYDYKVRILQSNAWGQGVFVYNKFEFFSSFNMGYTSYTREGLMKNGLFPVSSYGTGQPVTFVTPKIKGGVTYKFDMRNSVFLDAEYREEAPGVSNAYISVTTNGNSVSTPSPYKAKTAECGYQLKSPLLNLNITGYVTETTDMSYIMRFYNDDPAIRSFVNFVVNNATIRSIGTEFSGRVKLNSQWNLTGVAAIGQLYYANRPTVTVYQDNDPTMTTSAHTIYIKNYYVGNGPQSVYSLAGNYNPGNNWRGRINVNYIDRSYVTINPDRRTPQAVDLVPAGSAQWRKIIGQERLPAAYTVDVSGSKSFNVGKFLKHSKRRKSLYCSLVISNVLNKTDIKTTGYEQLRYDYISRNPDRFANKYDYAPGINFFANIALRF